jgi:hypothetical protein
MKISITQAARILGLDAHLLRWRIINQGVLKFASRTPRQTVTLNDVLAYRVHCAAPLKKPGRQCADVALLSDLNRKLARASRPGATGSVAGTIPSRRRSGSISTARS